MVCGTDQEWGGVRKVPLELFFLWFKLNFFVVLGAKSPASYITTGAGGRLGQKKRQSVTYYSESRLMLSPVNVIIRLMLSL
jgi:hypothetical protein